MRAYYKERLENAICFFAAEHHKRTGKPAYQTYIYKYLALFDFTILEREGQPALDLDYSAMENGPVPNLYYLKKNTDAYKFVPKTGKTRQSNYYIKPLKDPDLDYFSDDEINVMKSIIREFGYKGVCTQKVIDATHERIIAWKRAWDNRGEMKVVSMDYEDQFTDAASEELKEHFYTYKVFNSEARLSDSMG